MSNGSTVRARGTLCLPKLLLSLSAIAAMASPAWAETVQGRVLDPHGQAVAAAEVRFLNRAGGDARRTRSDFDGAYRLERISPGEYVYEAEASDAAMAASGPVEIGPVGDQTFDIQLEISELRSEVTVTSSATPLSVDETAKAIDSVDADEISRRGEFSIAEAIRHLPGVRVIQDRGPGSLVSIRTRGMRTQDTALLIDGLRFRDAAGLQGDASPFYQDLTIVDVERVELLRGSGSSLYGSNAIGGVLNVSSSQGGGRTHGEIMAEGGGLGMLRGVARVGGGLAQDRLVYSGGLSHLNVTRGVRDSAAYRNSSVHGFAKLALSGKTSISGRIWAADGFGQLAESPAFPEDVVANFPASGTVRAVALPGAQLDNFEQGQPYQAGRATFVPGYKDPDSRRTSSFLAAAATLKHQATPGSAYQLSYQAVDTNRGFDDGPAGVGLYEPFGSSHFSRFDGRVDTIHARTDQRIGSHQLVTAGYEFEREKYSNRETDEIPVPGGDSLVGISQKSHSFFAQDQLRLFDGRFQLAFSGRAQTFQLKTPSLTGDFNPYSGADARSPKTAYTGDVSAAYFFRSSNTKLRAHLGNAYRAPSSFERFGTSFYGGWASFWGDPELKPERSTAFDAGIDQWLANGKVRLSATAFSTELDETILFDFGVIDAATDPYGRYGGYRNGGGGRARGAEFSISASPVSSSQVTASYTYTDSQSNTPTIGTDFFKMQGLSDHLFNLTATQWFGKRWNAAFDLFAASDFSLSPFGAMGRRMAFDGPVKADVVLRYTLPISDGAAVEFYGKIENFLDRAYYENGFVSPGAWGLGGIKIRF